VTKAELVQEVIARGYKHVSPARIGGSLERSYQVICSRYQWRFLEADKAGVAPLVFTDLRRILSVTANEESLTGVDRRWLVSTYPDLTETGTATYWYLENQTLKTFPVDTAEVTTRYLKIPAALGEADEPLIPSEWQYLMVDRTVVDLLRDNDEYEEARALKLDVEEGLREMVHALLKTNYQGPSLVVRTGGPGDYLG
jgi:hypothetical protein